MKPSAILALVACLAHAAEPLEKRIENGFATNQGVKIHFAALGPKNGPLVVFVHGFPDFWYTWRSQMEALSAAGYRTVALDLRGYNLSDKPEGVENYDMRLLIGDVVAVIRAQSREKAIVVGHDWGGAISWLADGHHAPFRCAHQYPRAKQHEERRRKPRDDRTETKGDRGQNDHGLARSQPVRNPANREPGDRPGQRQSR